MYKINTESLQALAQASNLLNQLEVRGPQNAYILLNISEIMQKVISGAEEIKGEVISNVNNPRPIPKQKEETP